VTKRKPLNKPIELYEKGLANCGAFFISPI
jgi:hypothetical protein